MPNLRSPGARRILLAGIAAFAAVGSISLCPAAAQSATAPKVGSPAVVVDGFASPESVISDGNHHVFVSNMGAGVKPVAKDGDGFISEVDDAGHIVDLHAFPKSGAPLNAPKGLAIVGGRIYVADIDRVAGFDLATHARVFEAVLTGNEPALLNDIAVETEQSLIVTDTLRNAVYRLDLGSRIYSTIATDVGGANGVVIDHVRHLAYVVAVGADFAGGSVFRIALDGSKPVVTWKSPHGILDGVALLPTGELFISDWIATDHPTDGTITEYTTDGGRVRQLDVPIALRGPADFSYDAETGKLWIPIMLDNRVIAIDLAR